MKKTRPTYGKLKLLAIIISGLYSPLAFYVGYCFGSGQLIAGVIGLCFSMLLAVADTVIFWTLMEKINDKE